MKMLDRGSASVRTGSQELCAWSTKRLCINCSPARESDHPLPASARSGCARVGSRSIDVHQKHVLFLCNLN